MKEIKKPLLQTISFYDWNDSFEYIKLKYGSQLGIQNDGIIWNHICDTNEVHKGGILRLSDWDLKAGFKHLIPEWYIPVLNAFLDEFGIVNTDCLTPNTRVADFQTNW
jgi:hypothetical protein